jgi:hypothetical protein
MSAAIAIADTTTANTIDFATSSQPASQRRSLIPRRADNSLSAHTCSQYQSPVLSCPVLEDDHRSNKKKTMPAPCTECPDCGDMLSPAVPIRDCINCAGIMLSQVAMADRLAHAEAESAELPPYSWVTIGASGRAESDQEDEGDRQQSP